jgi:hypothetical protein
MIHTLVGAGLREAERRGTRGCRNDAHWMNHQADVHHIGALPEALSRRTCAAFASSTPLSRRYEVEGNVTLPQRSALLPFRRRS